MEIQVGVIETLVVAGSLTLSGGHGTGATYAELFGNHYNLQSVLEMAMAAATFGLVLGGLLGGPIAQRLIKQHNLKASDYADHGRPGDLRSDDIVTYDPEDRDMISPRRMMETLLLLALDESAISELIQNQGVIPITIPANTYQGVEHPATGVVLAPVFISRSTEIFFLLQTS